MCVVGKCFDTVRAAVDFMRERKGFKKVTVGELTLISRSLHKIPATFPPSTLNICLAIGHQKNSCNVIILRKLTGLQRYVKIGGAFEKNIGR